MIESINVEKCTGCGICMNLCPTDTYRIDPVTNKAYIAYPEDCITCYVCEMSCPTQAIYVHPFKEAMPLVIEYKKGKKNE